jgi:hypothetical protein
MSGRSSRHACECPDQSDSGGGQILFPFTAGGGGSDGGGGGGGGGGRGAAAAAAAEVAAAAAAAAAAVAEVAAELRGLASYCPYLDLGDI